MKHLVLFFAALFLFGCTKEAPSTSFSSEKQDPYSSSITDLDNQLTSGISPLLSVTDSTLLTEQEIAGLIFMREEEKLARDVYSKMEQLWSLRVFSNIKKSEHAHTTAIKYLLNKYGIPDPVATDIPGVFVNQDLQNLYNTLIARGSVSSTEALKVGKDIEVVDIEDLDHQLHTVVVNADIRRVYTNLMRASQFHLKAFTWWLPNPQTSM